MLADGNGGENWRYRAEEVRTRADTMKYSTARNTMLLIAEQYDNLAEVEEDRMRRSATSLTVADLIAKAMFPA